MGGEYLVQCNNHKKMTKTKYLVYKGKSLTAMYVTTKRNCEDMVRQIREMHEYYREHYRSKFMIVRVINNKETIVYTKRNKKLWEAPLTVLLKKEMKKQTFVEQLNQMFHQ